MGKGESYIFEKVIPGHLAKAGHSRSAISSFGRGSTRPRFCAERYDSDPAGSRRGCQIQRIRAARGIRAPESCTYPTMRLDNHELSLLALLEATFVDRDRSLATSQGQIEGQYASGRSSFQPTSRLKFRRYQGRRGDYQGAITFGLTGPTVVKNNQRTNDCLPHVRLGRLGHGDCWSHDPPLSRSLAEAFSFRTAVAAQTKVRCGCAP
jgi:hypothetical protein